VLVAVTQDPAAARAAVADRFGLAGRVPEYRAVLDREGAAGPGDVAVVGDPAEVARQLARYAEAGVTELFVSPIGDAAAQQCTVAALAEMAAALPADPAPASPPLPPPGAGSGPVTKGV
ncbi:hypothetical protein ND748_16885, partial [Frankia sp. AiPs1]|nr:hypothetical protein [Frankia sp. AiPs1]